MMEQQDMRSSFAGTAACVALGALALLIFGLQPLLYGAFVREGAIAETALGMLSAVEVLAIAVGSAAAIPLLQRVSPRVLASVGVVVNCGGNLVHAGAASGPLFFSRIVAGLGAGLLVGIGSAAIARTHRVGAWTAANLFGQAVSQFAVMTAVAAFVPNAGAWDVQRTLVCCAAACLVLLPLLPHALVEETRAEAVMAMEAMHRRPDGAALACLVAMFLYVGGAATMWAYAGLWLESRGVASAANTTILTINLAGQALGALGTVFTPEGRRDWMRIVLMTMLFTTAASLWLAYPSAVIWSFGFGLFWMSGSPALTSVLASIDPHRRAIPYAAAAQICGVALIPSAAGATLAARGLDILSAAAIAIVASSAFIVLALVPHIRKRYGAQAAA